MNNQNIGTLSDPLDNVIFRVNQKQDQGEGWVGAIEDSEMDKASP